MTSFNHLTMAGRFEAIMRRAGATTMFRTAGTGTVYVTVNEIFKVRFADHGECYCHEDISVDPDGCSLEQAVRAAARDCDLDVSRSLAAFKAATTRASRIAARRRAELEIQFAPERALEAARLAFQADYIAARYPDYDARSSKSRKRIRAAANKTFEARNGE